MDNGVFLGYPQKPRGIPDVMRSFAAALNSAVGVEAATWEDLKVDGKVVISEITSAIDNAGMAVFDVTYPNPNVLFELGYAIARAKPVWITLDSTVETAHRAWTDLALLKQVGYTAYRNSEDLMRRFRETWPITNLEPVYDSHLEAILPEASRQEGILYCATFEPFEAANKLNGLMDSRQRRGLKVSVSDPAETSLTTLEWFVPRIVESAGVLIHFAADNRNRARIHNNRHSLIAGMALGFEVPSLLLAEQDYSSPFDYETRLQVYEMAEECVSRAREWLDGLVQDGPRVGLHRRARRSSLAAIRFGEHVAENERAELADYFVETSAFHQVVAARDSIFIGHRGTGKTANAIQAFNKIASNKTNLAILIKPPSFEFPAILEIVGRLPEFQHDYFFDALWRFVIQTEIAYAIFQVLGRRSPNVPYDAEEQSFLDYIDSAEFDIKAEMSVRLEQALRVLRASLPPEPTDQSSGRNEINEAFHRKSLAVLRSQLGKVLRNKKRVAVFVDNLDKGWERGTDFTTMARFILGLLTARGQVVTDFMKEDYWRDSVKLTVAVFLRSDIYTYLRREAREPDKLPISSVKWDDWGALKMVLESRFLESELSPATADELWNKYFCPTVSGVGLQDFLRKVSLPRPRDIVFFCNAAVGRAIDRGHETVLEEDFLSALGDYSQYAFEALLVENGVTVPEMEDALLAFLDAPEIATRAERAAALGALGLADERIEPLLEKLTAMSFFGLETLPERFTFPEVGSDMAAARTRARRTEPENSHQRLIIHPAFHEFLSTQH